MGTLTKNNGVVAVMEMDNGRILVMSAQAGETADEFLKEFPVGQRVHLQCMHRWTPRG